MKKLLCFILILTIAFNFMTVSVTYANDPTLKLEQDSEPSANVADELTQEGGGYSFGDFGVSLLALIIGLVGAIFAIVAGVPFLIMNMAVNLR